MASRRHRRLSATKEGRHQGLAEHLLASRAPASHVELCVALFHHDAVGLLAPPIGGLTLILGLDGDAVDVGPLVRLIPQLRDRLVHVRHLCLVEAHERRVERLVVPAEVVHRHLDRLKLDELLAVLLLDDGRTQRPSVIISGERSGHQ